LPSGIFADTDSHTFPGVLGNLVDNRTNLGTHRSGMCHPVSERKMERKIHCETCVKGIIYKRNRLEGARVLSGRFLCLSPLNFCTIVVSYICIMNQ
jgi:hypothetical protein